MAILTINNAVCNVVIATIKYGYLYNGYAVTDSRNIANTGWHVITEAEILSLAAYAITSNDIKEVGIVYWDIANGTNTLKFNARGNGYRSGTIFATLRVAAENWTSTEDGVNLMKWIVNASTTAFATASLTKNYGFAVRSVKDSTTLLNDGDEGVYIGNDGVAYSTIRINGVEYVAYNLIETQYRNGDSIILEDSGSWTSLTYGVRCVYDNDESNR